jgi:ATP-dependent helicase/nuclease subunit B
MAAVLENALEDALIKAAIRPALATWWRPRLRRIAQWVAGWEMARGPASLSAAERAGEWVLAIAGGFTLAGRADRIERRADGGIVLIDFKTGTVPSERDVAQGAAPQLPLEAAMAAAGAFGQEFKAPAAALLYLHLTGGVTPGAERALFASDPAALAGVVADTEARLMATLEAFTDERTPYRANPPRPDRAAWRSDYAALARQDEWQVITAESHDDE